MATLTEDQKTFIVTRLAMYDTPSMIGEAFKERWPNVEAPSRQQIWQYDPEKQAAKRVAVRLVETFNAVRKNFLEQVGSIPIAQRSYRLRRLQAMHDMHMKRGNLVAAAAVLEQAAKEAGEVFTNKLKLDGKVNHDHSHDHEFKMDEKRATLAEIIEQALAVTAPPRPAGAKQTQH